MSKKPSLAAIFNEFESKVGDSFPDGDPIDLMLDWLRRNGLTAADLDKAVAKHSESKNYIEFMAENWDAFAEDQMYDAKVAHKAGRLNEFLNEGLVGQFVEVDRTTGEPKLKRNPWRG